MNGYGGKILKVNLTTGEIKEEHTTHKLAEMYIGSRGFASKILYDETPVGLDPFDEKSIVVVASGPLAGVFLPGSGKMTFAAKSPATGIYGDSNIGGHLAGEMKYAGYDAIVIRGRAASPVYLFIQDEKVEIRDAGDLWGKGAIQTETILKEKVGCEFQIATIGPAGENEVKIACVSHDFGRQAGRCGIGAVLGNKRLKGIAVRGTRGIPLFDPKRVLELGKELFADCRKHPALKEWQDYGTAGVTVWANEIGAFPTRNFQSGFFEGYKNLSGVVMREKIVVLDKACFCCPMACGKYSHVKKPELDFFVEGPEYETTALVGGNCALDRIEDVAEINYLCDELGIDTISAGNVIAFAIECFEKGIIGKDRTDGLALAFGDAEAVKTLTKKIAARQGIGDVLAQGVRFAAEKFGKNSIRFAMQVKGLEWSGYESRGAPAMLLAYSTCDIGSHHNRAWAITHDIAAGREKIEQKAEKVIELQHIRPMFDMLGVCRLQWVELAIDLEKYAAAFAAVTGINYTLRDLLRASERVYNLNRMFAVRERIATGREFDYPPARIYEEPIPTGSTKGMLITRAQIDRLLDDYYRLRGWDSDGIPTPEKLRQLDLAETISDLPERCRA